MRWLLSTLPKVRPLSVTGRTTSSVGPVEMFRLDLECDLPINTPPARPCPPIGLISQAPLDD
jgi:hypothetical protein